MLYQDEGWVWNENQNQILYTVMIKKNYKKETNKEKGIDINATLVFAVPVEDHNQFLQEEDIQKEVVLVQKCKYYNNGHQYIVDDKISAGSTVQNWKKQQQALESSDDFPFEKLKYFLDKNSLEWKDSSLNLHISIKLIATKITSSFENRICEEYPLKTISFDQNAEEYLKDQFVDCTEHLQKIFTVNKNIQYPINYPEILRDKLNLQLKMNQIIQLNQSVHIEQFRIQSSLNIQNVYAYTCYQVTIKSKNSAQPIRILSRQQLSNWKNVIDVVELSNHNVSQVPFIYDSPKITCKHFLIINLQYKSFFQTKGIDILVPIVIIDPYKKHCYQISKNKIDEYFEMKISQSIVTFTLNQHIRTNENILSLENQEDQETQDNIIANYEQLLNSADN